MSSTVKTLELLGYFSAQRPEIGLSQFCRLAGRDKATTYRHLQALEETGFVEQNAATKGYRLGPVVLQLAQTREVTVPRKAGVETVLHGLAHATGETAHVSVLSGTALYLLAACESPAHGVRVIMDMDRLPLHATASGLCALSFGPDTLFAAATADLTPFTDTTVTTATALSDQMHEARSQGFARSAGSIEAGTHSLATPIFDQAGFYAGSVSVATVATRLTPELEQTIQTQLIAASRQISHNWGGTIPRALEHVWQQAISPLDRQDKAS